MWVWGGRPIRQPIVKSDVHVFDPDQTSTAVHLTMSGTCLGEKRPSAWMRNHGFPVVRTCHMGQRRRLAWHNARPTSHEVQVCVAASPKCHLSSYHSQQPNISCFRISLESAGASQLAPLRTTCSQCLCEMLCPTTWTRGWSFFGLKISQRFGKNHCTC